jgi:hypothetical protein
VHRGRVDAWARMECLGIRPDVLLNREALLGMGLQGRRDHAMSLRGKGLKGQQRRHALFSNVTDDVMLSAVRGENRRGYASGTLRQRQKQPPRQRTIAYLGTIPEEGASAQERAQFWAGLLPRLNRLRLEPAAFDHIVAQLVAVVPPPTRRELAPADRSEAERAAKHAAWKAPWRCRRVHS